MGTVVLEVVPGDGADFVEGLHRGDVREGVVQVQNGEGVHQSHQHPSVVTPQPVGPLLLNHQLTTRVTLKMKKTGTSQVDAISKAQKAQSFRDMRKMF